MDFEVTDGVKTLMSFAMVSVGAELAVRLDFVSLRRRHITLRLLNTDTICHHSQQCQLRERG